MKPFLATALHVVIVIATACTLTVGHALISVYLLGDVDSKFGAAGTVQFLGFIALLCSSVAAAGSGLFHFFWLRRFNGARPALAAWSGVIVGGVLALVHRPLVFEMPLLSGIRDWHQQSLYFLVLGYVLHWIVVTMANVIGARPSGATR